MPNLASSNTKLDDLAAPDDNTDLNASTSAHGLLKKLDNTATNYLNGQGNWAAPAPVDAQYVTLATNSTLTVERVATGGDGVTITDAGAGSTATFDFDYIDLARKRVGFVEDFFNQAYSEGLFGGYSNGGSIYLNSTVVESNKFGVAEFSTTTDSSGAAGWVMGELAFLNQASYITLGLGTTTFETLIKTPSSLSDGTNRYKIFVGLTDSFESVAINDGVYFEYIDTGSTAWRYCTANDGTRTETASSTTVATSTWYRLKIVVNAAASSVEYFVNGASAGTISTNIPTAAGDELTLGVKIHKTLGTSDRLCLVDYIAFQIDLTTLR